MKVTSKEASRILKELWEPLKTRVSENKSQRLQNVAYWMMDSEESFDGFVDSKRRKDFMDLLAHTWQASEEDERDAKQMRAESQRVLALIKSVLTGEKVDDEQAREVWRASGKEHPGGPSNSSRLREKLLAHAEMDAAILFVKEEAENSSISLFEFAKLLPQENEVRAFVIFKTLWENSSQKKKAEFLTDARQSMSLSNHPCERFKKVSPSISFILEEIKEASEIGKLDRAGSMALLIAFKEGDASLAKFCGERGLSFQSKMLGGGSIGKEIAENILAINPKFWGLVEEFSSVESLLNAVGIKEIIRFAKLFTMTGETALRLAEKLSKSNGGLEAAKIYMDALELPLSAALFVALEKANFSGAAIDSNSERKKIRL